MQNNTKRKMGFAGSAWSESTTLVFTRQWIGGGGGGGATGL